MNTAASTMAGQMLNTVVDNMNNNVRKQILEGLKAKGATLTADQVSNVVTPITKKVTNVNETGKIVRTVIRQFLYFNRYGLQV